MKLITFLFLFPALAQAKLNVVTTITDLAVIAREVGGDEVIVDAIAKGTQDPHFIEAKPSYMVKLSKADLLVAVGLELEVGWVPSLILGARNPKVKTGEKGYLEIGPSIDPLEIPTGKISRSDGDVHPDGNPHFYLDPIRLGKTAQLIAARLGELDPTHAAEFTKRGEAFAARMKTKSELWRARLVKTGVKKIVTYHKTLTYFFDRFGIANPAILEPKPGIPPTSGHIIEVIELMKQQKVPLILVENFFDASVTKKITNEVPGSRAASVAVNVEGESNIKTNEDLIENLVKAIEGK
jgi:zinc/manganese transport system substrate-binding protein